MTIDHRLQALAALGVLCRYYRSKTLCVSQAVYLGKKALILFTVDRKTLERGLFIFTPSFWAERSLTQPRYCSDLRRLSVPARRRIFVPQAVFGPKTRSQVIRARWLPYAVMPK